MNTILFRKQVFWLLSMATAMVIGNGLSAVAQTVGAVGSQPNPQYSAIDVSPYPDSAEVEPFTPTLVPSTPVQPTVPTAHISPVLNISQPQPKSLLGVAKDTHEEINSPIPGTTLTSSTGLLVPRKSSSSNAAAKKSTSRVAQADIGVEPGRATRGGSSYIGLGANIGIAGDESALGDGNFAAFSKIGLTNTISVRPAGIIGSSATIIVPITYDFTFVPPFEEFAEPLPIAPYVGAGAAIRTGEDFSVAFLVSGGVDVPFSVLGNSFTATASLNAAFFDETALGFLIGIGYNFPGFGF